MINSSGTNPGKYVRGINSIMKKVKATKKEDKSEEKVDKDHLNQFVGYYSQMPWWGESYIGVWEGKLVSLGLPSEKPGESMTFYKYIEGDTFQRIRDNKELGETLEFKRDKEGNIIHYVRHGNYSRKISK